MSFRTRRVIMMTPFYMLFEFFLLKYILALIIDVNDVYVLVITVLLGIWHFAPTLFEEKRSTSIGRFLSTLYGIWMWMAVMFLIDILIIYLIGFFVEIPRNIIFIMLLAVPILAIYNYCHAHKMVVHEKTLDLNCDMAIAHLSDVHFGSVRNKEVIGKVADKLIELESVCDIAIISGDLADGSCVVCEDDFMELKKVNMPIIFTPGNHDFYPGIENVIKACKKAEIIILDNEKYEFENLNIYGLTYSFGDIPMPSADEIKESMGSNKINVINYHVPQNWDVFSDMGFDLQLSGHTHGGQFYPVVWLGNLMFKYNKGLFKNGSGKYLHVTTGVGSMDTPMRWGTDSEIVVLKLKKK